MTKRIKDFFYSVDFLSAVQDDVLLIFSNLYFGNIRSFVFLPEEAKAYSYSSLAPALVPVNVICPPFYLRR